jgi:hypothetical protein
MADGDTRISMTAAVGVILRSEIAALIRETQRRGVRYLVDVFTE